MPVRKDYTPEFKDQAVRFVLEEMEPDESRKQACERLGPGRGHGATSNTSNSPPLPGWNGSTTNDHRLHGELGDIPPAEFEANYYARSRAETKVPKPTRI